MSWFSVKRVSCFTRFYFQNLLLNRSGFCLELKRDAWLCAFWEPQIRSRFHLGDSSSQLREIMFFNVSPRTLIFICFGYIKCDTPIAVWYNTISSEIKNKTYRVVWDIVWSTLTFKRCLRVYVWSIQSNVTVPYIGFVLSYPVATFFISRRFCPLCSFQSKTLPLRQFKLYINTLFFYFTWTNTVCLTFSCTCLFA